MANSTDKLVISARLSFPNIAETEKYQGTDTGNYSATLIIDDEDAEKLKALGLPVVKEVAGKKYNESKVLLSDRCALRGPHDDDEDTFAPLRGKYTVKAANKRRPLCLGVDKTPLTSNEEIASELYGGAYVQAVVTAWSTSGFPELRFNLVAIKKVKDGERFAASEDPDELVDMFD